MGLCGGFGVELGDFFLEEALGYGDVADELAFERVIEAAGPGEFADFADVVDYARDLFLAFYPDWYSAQRIYSIRRRRTSRGTGRPRRSSSTWTRA